MLLDLDDRGNLCLAVVSLELLAVQFVENVAGGLGLSSHSEPAAPASRLGCAGLWRARTHRRLRSA